MRRPRRSRAPGRGRAAPPCTSRWSPARTTGATPPCADAIIAAGIASVSCAPSRIPIRASPAAGSRACAPPASRSSAGCWPRPRTGWRRATSCASPSAARFVQAKLALAPMGRCRAAPQGQPVWATSPPARGMGHLLRARADAILVGRRTVIDDDPLLTCRLPGLEDRSPIRVVLARRLEGLQASRLALTARERGLVGLLRGMAATRARSRRPARASFACRRSEAPCGCRA